MASAEKGNSNEAQLRRISRRKLLAGVLLGSGAATLLADAGYFITVGNPRTLNAQREASMAAKNPDTLEVAEAQQTLLNSTNEIDGLLDGQTISEEKKVELKNANDVLQRRETYQHAYDIAKDNFGTKEAAITEAVVGATGGVLSVSGLALEISAESEEAKIEVQTELNKIRNPIPRYPENI